MQQRIAFGTHGALLRILSWILASSGSALLAHAIIELLGRSGMASDDYGRRAHAAFGPVAAGASILAVTVLIGAVLQSLSRQQSEAAVARAVRVLGSTPAWIACVAVAAGGLAVLLGMEFGEQLATAGRIQGIGDALGGDIASGLAVVAVSAIVVSTAFLRSVRSIVDAGVAVARVLVGWVLAASSARARDAASRAYRIRHPRHASAAAFLARASGLRAPPAFA